MSLNFEGVLRHGGEEAAWVARLRSLPSGFCPSEEHLALFAAQPLAVEGSTYAHVVRGCASCRTRLQRLLLGGA